jgi:hypothetical protein
VTLDQARDVAAHALQLDDAGAVARLVAPLLAASPAPDG